MAGWRRRRGGRTERGEEQRYTAYMQIHTLKNCRRFKQKVENDTVSSSVSSPLSFSKTASGVLFLIKSRLIFPFPSFPLASTFFSFPRMVLVFISFVLCPLVMSAGQIFCVRSARAHVDACLFAGAKTRGVFERKRPGVTKNKVMTEVTPVRSSVFGSLCWLLVKQASSLIRHLYRGYALFIPPFFIFLSSLLKCRNTSWMCMEQWETYGLCGETRCPPHSLATHTFSANTHDVNSTDKHTR